VSRLRELRLHGFKSFADPTRFVFEPGVNAVIGPNGSGKSNMADAVRWVLGEQSNRSLRTRRADDVIFAGSEQRKAQGMAEAILTLDNAEGWLPIDFGEVSIGRRAYRSGDSEYLINGARARLRDVVELLGEGRLGANELVVVGQGTVDAALSLRPDERRQLFEEAAGVKGLQVKRNEATVRLAKAVDNLTRVTDLIGELKPQARRLALQAQHQQEHDGLVARARGLVDVSHRRRESAARAALGDARRSAAAAESAVAAQREADAARRQALAEAEERYWRAEEAARAAARAREETREAVIRAESRLEGLADRLAELTADVARDEAALAAAVRSLGQTDEEAVEDVAPAVATAAEAEEAWRRAVGDLAAADEELLNAEEALAEVRARASERIAAAARASEEAARRAARRDEAAGEMDEVHAALQALIERRSAVRNEKETAERALTGAATDLARALEDRDVAQSAADATRQEALEIAERLRAARAELGAIEEPLGAEARLGRRLAAAGWSSLLDAIEAPEDAWPAVEAVVGGGLESALVWGDADPRAQMGDARGAARLLALSAPNGHGRNAALSAVGGSRTLADWVGGPAAPAAFHRTAVARDIDALIDGWRRLPEGWSAVTTEGDLADARGLIVLRGRADPAGGAEVRTHARRRELTAAVASMESTSADTQRRSHEAAERLRAARDAHIRARDAHEAAEVRARRARQETTEVAAEIERLERRQHELDSSLATLRDSEASSPAAAAPSEVEDVGAHAAAARTRRDALAVVRDAARERWSATRLQAQALETATATRRRDRAADEARAAGLRAGLPSRMAARDAMESERAALEAAATTARAADAEAAAALQAAEKDRTGQRTALLELERGQGDEGARAAELERTAQATAIEASRREEAVAGLARERDLALDGLPETDQAAPMEEIASLADGALDTELRRVRRTLAQIGSVNPFAVEEHAEVAGRLEQMTSQDADLRAAIGATEELIGHLDTDIAERFDAAFRAIGEKFDEYCRLLFAGGSASLQVADEADGDAPGGIEIVVRPPGKRLQRLAMLSGGERALTGVALLFAMLTVNPVPFCILDEVDAALDEANIGRFAAALRKLAESIDFVVITHNRATIEVADTIYGVTMTDAAVSRLLSLRLADVPVEAGAS
jgi:chromosome segregation protein